MLCIPCNYYHQCHYSLVTLAIITMYCCMLHLCMHNDKVITIIGQDDYQYASLLWSRHIIWSIAASITQIFPSHHKCLYYIADWNLTMSQQVIFRLLWLELQAHLIIKVFVFHCWLKFDHKSTSHFRNSVIWTISILIMACTILFGKSIWFTINSLL